ncbi:GNAT family N-acetyltransferase [Winogradskyella sp. PG-2]|uniref:GNAT family N-acetyltransferase n=1 Tax=Winogradskyella sp. PG-2 TaxID=754409 RepID=UPI0004587606|nr:GNAT family N-acetyltransferase [Winogradskyella sp. PG-2]BAO76739.1 protease synthase and sporulation negative regulatory protein pai 1 [Winogradskyella sp. PG-2]
MIKIKQAQEADIDVLALLARLTWAESHGHYIEDKNDLLKYLNKNFSVSKTTQDINNPKQIFYIVYVNDLPVGYAKLILNAENESVVSQNNCRLERIFILNDFIPLKIGKQLLHFVEEEAKKLLLDTIWLTVYIKNSRAIRFYEKNEFKNVGDINFIVSGKAYENIVFSKKI